jgi:hypothetical protein
MVEVSQYLEDVGSGYYSLVEISKISGTHVTRPVTI